MKLQRIQNSSVPAMPQELETSAEPLTQRQSPETMDPVATRKSGPTESKSANSQFFRPNPMGDGYGFSRLGENKIQADSRAAELNAQLDRLNHSSPADPVGTIKAGDSEKKNFMDYTTIPV